MTVRTSKQSKQDHVQIMGEELGSLYSALFQETAWIYIKWLEYKELYYNPDGQNRRVELLNLAAKNTFGRDVFGNRKNYRPLQIEKKGKPYHSKTSRHDSG